MRSLNQKRLLAIITLISMVSIILCIYLFKNMASKLLILSILLLAGMLISIMKMTQDIFILLEQYNKKLEKELAERNSEISAIKLESDSSKQKNNEFFAIMNHEIRTPMNGIVAVNELLMDTDLNDEQQEYVYMIKDNSELLMALLNDFLDLNKIEQGELNIQNIIFSPENIIRQIISTYESIANKKGIIFTGVYAALIPDLLIGDPVKLRQLLLNLLNNAVNFTEKGEIDLSVSIRELTEENVVLLFCIHDTGIGISKEMKSEIFLPFKQANIAGSKKYGGSGLGLYICKRIVENMQGEIGFSSIEGEGSMFHFSISFRIATEKEYQSEFLTDHSSQYSKMATSKKVLIIDDVDFNRVILSRQLAKLGIESDICENGPKALEMIKKNDYSLILLDCLMSVMDGFETTALIRKIPELKQIPIIAVSASYQEQKKYLEAGMDDFLSKPVTLEALRKTIAKYLYEDISLKNFLEVLTCPDEQMIEEQLISNFIKDTSERLVIIEKAILNNDLYTVIVNVHGIKSGGKFINEYALFELCVAMETFILKNYGNKHDLVNGKLDTEQKEICLSLLKEIEESVEELYEFF